MERLCGRGREMIAARIAKRPLLTLSTLTFSVHVRTVLLAARGGRIVTQTGVVRCV